MSDIHLAFAHPEERSLQSAHADPRDRISLRDHIVEFEIGAFQQERGHNQRVMFNIVAEVRPITAPLNDDVDRILSYDRITEAIAAEIAAERLNLLETLAERVAERILAEPQAMRVFIRIEKLDVGPYKLGVEISRSRAESGLHVVDQNGQAAEVHPHVVYLGKKALADKELPQQIEQALVDSPPIIFTLGRTNIAHLENHPPPVQRRINLLSIEQNAWALAGRIPQLAVVATRTEIDWAIKRGQSVIWAPSKMVLDAVDGPKSGAPLSLALWLSEQMAAEKITIQGSDTPLPPGSRIPIERV